MKKKSVMVCAALFFGMLLTASGAGAAGDADLQSMQNDIYSCFQKGPVGEAARVAFSQKYNVPLSKIDELAANAPGSPPRSNGGWDYGRADFICSLEVMTGIGAYVWGIRMAADDTGCVTGGTGITRYCTCYSVYCDHYNWQKGCLRANPKSCKNCLKLR